MRIFNRILEKLYRVAAKCWCGSIIVGAAGTPVHRGGWRFAKQRAVEPHTHNSSWSPRMSGQRKSRTLVTKLLISPLALAAASDANAQVFGPSPPTITTTVEVFSPTNSPVTIVGNTAIDTPGDAFDAPPFNAPGGSLTIDTESGPSHGPISITSGGGRCG